MALCTCCTAVFGGVRELVDLNWTQVSKSGSAHGNVSGPAPLLSRELDPARRAPALQREVGRSYRQSVLLSHHSLASVLADRVAHATLLGQRQSAGTSVQHRGEGRGITRPAQSIAEEGGGHPSARASRPVLDGRGRDASLSRLGDCHRMAGTKGSGGQQGE